MSRTTGPHPAHFIVWASGIQQADIAQAAGCDPSLVSRYLRGEREATPEFKRRVAELLHTPVDILFRAGTQ